jgi:hypothetical protein
VGSLDSSLVLAAILLWSVAHLSWMQVRIERRLRPE